MQKETIFHAFAECSRFFAPNTFFFTLLIALFIDFNYFFSLQTFILGIKYTQKTKEKSQLLNYIVGQKTKMGIPVYPSQRNKVDQKRKYSVVTVTIALIKVKAFNQLSF